MLKGLGDLANLPSVLRQAMDVKQRIEELKEQLAHETVEAAAGGGMVKVVLNGRCEVLSISIEPEVINVEEREFLETLVRAAINSGVQAVQERAKEKMKEIAAGIDIPGIL